MSIAEIMDVTKICRYFPNEPKPEIIRDSFLETIEAHFSIYPVVIVEGLEGIGKTTLLAQFCKKHPMNTISIFINPITRSSYDPDQLRLDLLNQVTWLLTKEEIENPEGVDIKNMWGLKKWELQRKARNSRQNYFFIIDGLSEIPEDEAKYRELIIDLFPFGESNEFKFLISGSVENLPKEFVKRTNYKNFTMSGFTIDEAIQCLANNELNRDDLKKLYQVSKLPGFYASINRIVKSGISIANILDDLPKNCPDAFEIEWKTVNLENVDLVNLLAVLAFSRIDFALEEISQIVSLNVEIVKDLLLGLNFVVIENDGCIVRFVNDSFRKFVSSRLYKQQEDIENKIINHLRSQPSNNRSMAYLPMLYSQSGKYSELLSFLTPENLYKMMEIYESLIPLRETTRLGVKAAQQLRRDGDLIGFSLQASIIQKLMSSDIWESEIEALIALKDSKAALSLIERATTKEDRFYLLSVLANARQRNQLDIQGIEERIENLYKQIDVEKLGDHSIDIAANLINILPELAFEIVEISSKSEVGENALDWAFAKLSIVAIQKNGDELTSSDVIGKIQSRIKNPNVKNFSTATIAFFDYSSARIIAEVEKIERASEKLYLLRAWVMKNRESENALEVVDYGLKIAINTTDYSPNARDYRQLATPLPYTKNLNSLRKFISIFDGQKGTIEKLGPIEDYVRLSLILASAEKQFDEEASINRMVETYLYIYYLEDLETKSSCLARYAVTLASIDPSLKFDEKEKLHSLTENDLECSVNELIANSADQYLTTKGIIRALARKKSSKALEIASKLNGVDRRDKAILNLIKSVLETTDSNLDLLFIKKCFDQIENRDLKDAAYLEIISRISISEKIERNKGIATYFLDHVNEIFDPQKRCNACCLLISAYKILDDIEKEGFEAKVLKTLEVSWNEIDAEWDKVNIGFKIVEAFIDYPEEINKYITKIHELRETTYLDSNITVETYIEVVSLSIRAFSGLFSQKLDTGDELSRIYNLIDEIPSALRRVELYCELALRYRSYNRNDKFSEIIRLKVKPEIYRVSQEENFIRQQLIVTAAPAIYGDHPASALTLFRELPLNLRDEAFEGVANFILTKRVTTDPYYNPGINSRRKLSFEDISDVIAIIKEMDQDAAIFYMAFEIVESVNEHRSDFSRQQRAEIARQLEESVLGKFPNPRYIQHEGYRIITEAQILKIKQTNQVAWENLLTRSRKITNVADRVFIMAYIAQAVPKTIFDAKRKILEEAARDIKNIPSVIDQINRYEILAQSAENLDIKLAKTFIKSGAEIASRQSSPDALTAQRRLIDYAYKLDPDLAASLASLSDDDPSRQDSQAILKKRLETLRLKDQIINIEQQGILQDNAEERLYTQASWSLLGSLNAGRVAPVHFEKIRRYADVASRLSLTDSYPIFAWLIQNGILRYQDTPQAVDYIRPIYEACIASCYLIAYISKKSTSRAISNRSIISREKDAGSQVLQEMNDEEVKRIITKWLRTNLANYLYIADGYFGPDDLWILQEINSIDPTCKVYILTSNEHNVLVQQPWKNAYQDHWNVQLSDQDPPPTEIIVVGIKSTGKSPIHDRWWITNGAGLRLGTSLNSIGKSRISEISDLTLAEVSEREAIIRQYVISKERFFKGEKLTYSSFTL